MKGGLSRALKDLVRGHASASAKEVACQETTSIIGPGEDHVLGLGPTQGDRVSCQTVLKPIFLSHLFSAHPGDAPLQTICKPQIRLGPLKVVPTAAWRIKLAVLENENVFLWLVGSVALYLELAHTGWIPVTSVAITLSCRITLFTSAVSPRKTS